MPLSALGVGRLWLRAGATGRAVVVTITAASAAGRRRSPNIVAATGPSDNSVAGSRRASWSAPPRCPRSRRAGPGRTGTTEPRHRARTRPRWSVGWVAVTATRCWRSDGVASGWSQRPGSRLDAGAAVVQQGGDVDLTAMPPDAVVACRRAWAARAGHASLCGPRTGPLPVGQLPGRQQRPAKDGCGG